VTAWPACGRAAVGSRRGSAGGGTPGSV